MGVRAKYKLEESTPGNAYILEARLSELAKLDPRSRVFDFYLNPPQTLETTDVLADTSLVSKEPKPCKVESKRLRGERGIKAIQGNIEIKERIQFKEYGITQNGFASAAFKDLQNQLKSCMSRYTIFSIKMILPKRQ